MRNVISAIEKIVDEDLPVAMDVVGAAVEEVQLADSQRRDAFDQSSEEFLQGRSMRVEVYEDETLPYLDANRHQAVLSAVEVFYTLELGHAFQRSVQTVVPTVIGTTQQRCLTTRLGYDGRGMMTTHI